MLDELLEAYREADEDDRTFIEEEFKATADLEKKAITSKMPSWERVRWGFESAKNDEHFNECRKIWLKTIS